MAVYEPALMLQGDSWLATVYVLFKAALAIGLWGAVFTGFLHCRMPWWERLLGFVAGAGLIMATPMSDEIGFVLVALFLAQHFWRGRHSPLAAA